MDMKNFVLWKGLAVGASVAALSILSLSGSARAEETSGDMGLYLSGLIGYGMPASTEAEVDSGLAYGGSIGWKIMPDLSIAFTYLRDDFSTTLGDLDYTVS